MPNFLTSADNLAWLTDEEMEQREAQRSTDEVISFMQKS